MLYIEIETALKPLQEKLASLEATAQVDVAADRAREGSLFPLGIDGEKVDPEEYFADEADHTRRGIRKAYFSVADESLRRELINTYREIESARADLLDRAVTEQQQAVQQAKMSVRRLPWGTSLLIASAGAVIGYLNDTQSGVVVGVVLGGLTGLAYAWNAKGKAESELEQAENLLLEAKRDKKIRRLYPRTFSDQEAFTCTEDREFGRENARWNVRKFLTESD